MFYFTMHSTHFIWLYGIGHLVKTIQIAREKTRHHHIGYSFLLAAYDFLYAPSLRLDSTYHSLLHQLNGSTMKDQSDVSSHHERSPLPWSYIYNIDAGRFYLMNSCITPYHLFPFPFWLTQKLLHNYLLIKN